METKGPCNVVASKIGSHLFPGERRRPTTWETAHPFRQSQSLALGMSQYGDTPVAPPLVSPATKKATPASGPVESANLGSWPGYQWLVLRRWASGATLKRQSANLARGCGVGRVCAFCGQRHGGGRSLIDEAFGHHLLAKMGINVENEPSSPSDTASFKPGGWKGLRSNKYAIKWQILVSSLFTSGALLQLGPVEEIELRHVTAHVRMVIVSSPVSLSLCIY